MSIRQQQPNASSANSDRLSDIDRDHSVLSDRTVVYDRAAQERAMQEKAARDSYQQGYIEGRDRAAKDYANVSAQYRPQPERNGTGTTLGILFGILMTAIIGGSIAASFYFDGRIDALRSETENLNETLEQRERELEEADAEDGNPFRNLFQRDNGPEERGFESIPSEQPVESLSPQVPDIAPIEPQAPPAGDLESDASSIEAEVEPGGESSSNIDSSSEVTE